MVSSKKGRPMPVKAGIAVTEVVHPTHNLSIGDEEQISNLQKLQPTLLANQTAYETPDLQKLRTSFKYLYVMNWLYNYRGYLKLQSDYFDVDLFELELMQFFPPSNHLLNSDESTQRSESLVNKLKLALISIVQGSKLSSINNFEKIFRLWFGIDTPLGGEDEEEEEEVVVNSRQLIDPNITFDQLSITAKFEIFYILISHITNYQNFRNWIDRNNLSLESLRMNPIFTESAKSGPSLITLKTLTSLVTLKSPNSQTQSQVDYFLLFENNRLYKRTVLFPSLAIPKKRKLAPEYPEEFFAPEQFDINPEIKFELIFKNVYEFDEYLKEISSKKSAKTLYTKLSKASLIDSIFSNELKKRKFIVNKRKEQQLVSLLATRKRSSRLEAKEKQRQDELREQQEQEEFEFKLASEKRMERRRKVKEQMGIMDYGHGLSRDDRLKMRKLGLNGSDVVPQPVEQSIDEESHNGSGNLPPVEESNSGHDNLPPPTQESHNGHSYGELEPIAEYSNPSMDHGISIGEQETVPVPPQNLTISNGDSTIENSPSNEPETLKSEIEEATGPITLQPHTDI